MKSMNDLSKKKEEELSGAIPSGSHSFASEEHYYKKLDAYLLLVYQAYLKKETQVEAETKTALRVRVKQDPELALKVRMMQLDYLAIEPLEMDGEWNEASDVLFPEIEASSKAIDEARKMIIADYKETISTLLESSNELSS